MLLVSTLWMSHWIHTPMYVNSSKGNSSPVFLLLFLSTELWRKLSINFCRSTRNFLFFVVFQSGKFHLTAYILNINNSPFFLSEYLILLKRISLSRQPIYILKQKLKFECIESNLEKNEEISLPTSKLSNLQDTGRLLRVRQETLFLPFFFFFFFFSFTTLEDQNKSVSKFMNFPTCILEESN